MTDYIIIGCGVAGVAAATNIRKLDPTGVIRIFNNEPYPFYTRIRLPELIAGDIKKEKLFIYPLEWYTQKKIKLHLNEPVKDINPQDKQVISSINKSYPYDYLLLATGGSSFIPPINGIEKEGVFTLRSIEDALAIRNYAKHVRSAIVIGGGLLGLEAGNGLRKSGLKVNIVEFFPRLLPRQMDILGAEILKKQMEEMGLYFYLDARTKAILGKNHVEGILLDNGQKIEGDMVLISAGVTANTKLAKSLGLQMGRGIVVNDLMQTSINNIFAGGDLIEHRGIFYGIWSATQRQGEIAGINMAGGKELYEGTVPSNVLKVVGINMVSAGEIDVDGKFDAIVNKDIAQYSYRKLIVKNDVLIGCILLGDIRGKKEILDAIEKKKTIGAVNPFMGH